MASILWISDHIHPWLAEHEHSPCAWSVLGGIAATTEQIELITGVTCPIVRYHPVIIAKASRQPTVAILPADVQDLEIEEPSVEHFVSRTGVGHASTRISPPDDELRRAAQVLNEGEKVVMLVGQGALDATDEVLAVAERLGAGIITALLGKGVVPGDVPYHTQQLGLLGSKPSWDMIQNCDTLLMVGSNFPYGEFMPPKGQAAEGSGPWRPDRSRPTASQPALPDGGESMG